MYGLIHRGLRDMVLDFADEAVWQAIEHDLGTGPTELVSAIVYDDALTLRFVTAVAQALNLTVEACLERYGQHWVRFAERGRYGSILNFTGTDLPTFLANLDRMHQAVILAMPAAQVPSFTLLSHDDQRLVVRYASPRQGLDPFVRGLLCGLLERFGQTGEVRMIAARNDGADFEITLDPDSRG